MDLNFAAAAVIFTLLAIVAATCLLSGSRSAASVCAGQGPKEAAEGRKKPEPEPNGHLPMKGETKEVEEWSEMSRSSPGHQDVVESVHDSGEPSESLGFTDDTGSDSDTSMRYVPGKARSHHLEKMMSQEELDEEKRVQQEQLAAIFQLLRDNKETFGDVSEGDMEEQLKLYSI